MVEFVTNDAVNDHSGIELKLIDSVDLIISLHDQISATLPVIHPVSKEILYSFNKWQKGSQYFTLDIWSAHPLHTTKKGFCQTQRRNMISHCLFCSLNSKT